MLKSISSVRSVSSAVKKNYLYPTMKALQLIKENFSPVQPSLKGQGHQATYQEQYPNGWLANFIYCYWELKTHQPLTDDFTYRVVADGCIDMIWEVSQPQDNFIIGFSTSYAEFDLPQHFHYIGIRFLPTAVPLLYQINASELTNKLEWLRDVLPTLSKDLSDLTTNKIQLSEIKTILDNYFEKKVSTTNLDLDSRIFEAIHHILQSQGTTHLEKDLQTGISPRQLRRKFKYYIGDSPKTFCKVIRFQNILQAKPSKESLRKNKLFFDLGYYDQAHFIKDFKHLYGLTPSTALQ